MCYFTCISLSSSNIRVVGDLVLLQKKELSVFPLAVFDSVLVIHVSYSQVKRAVATLPLNSAGCAHATAGGLISKTPTRGTILLDPSPRRQAGPREPSTHLTATTPT